MNNKIKIGNLSVFITSDAQLVISKNRWSKYFEMVFFLALPIIFIGVILYFLSNIKNLTAWVLVIFFLLALIVIAFYNIKRSIRKHRDFIIFYENGKISINNNFFSNYQDLSPITILKFVDGDGASSYNIVISGNQKTCPVAFDLSKIEAITLAEVLSKYLQKEFTITSGKMIIP